MSAFPLSGFSAPRRVRTVLRFLLGLLAVLPGGAHASPPAVAFLADGFTQEIEICGGEIHTFPIDLRTGQFLRVFVEEQGIDVAVKLFDSQGKLVAAADNQGTDYTEITEDLAALAEATGPHWLEVTSASEGSGRYVLRVEGPRAPAEADNLRAEAVQAAWKGQKAGDPTEQIRSLERAADLWHAAGDVENEFVILFEIGRKRYEELNARDRALVDFHRGAEFWHSRPGRRSRILEIEALTWMARCLRHAERREEARAAHEKALSMSRDLGVAGLQGENANLLGLLDYEAGKLQRAIDLFSQALPLAREAGDQGTEYRALNNLAASHELLGHVQEALTLYLEALRMARAIPKPKDEIIFLNNLGETYRSLGELEKALEHYRLAIEKSDALKDRLLSSRFLINQASAYRQKGQLDSARLSLERALALAREIPSRREQVLALGQLAFLALALQQQESAIGYAREAVSLAKSLEEQTIAKYALGSALRVVGETGDAQTALTEALGLAIRRAERGQQAEISLALARMERDAGRLDSALQRIQSAIHLIESRRGGLVDLKLRTSFLASRQDYYHFEIDTLMGLHAKSPASGFAAAALQVSETARARGLLDLLNEADVGLGADPALLEKLRQVREEMNEREYGRARLAAESPDSEKLLEAEKKLNAALEEYQKVQVELRQSSPSYEALTQPRILGVAEIQQQILDGKALFLEYSLGAQRSFLWAVGPDSFASFELAGREEIERAARLYYELLTVRNNKRPGESVPAWKARIKQADGEVESAAHELSRRILDPVEKMLGDRTLLIVADGALQYIPFAALPVPGTGDPLASRHEIVNLPSASVLAILRREPRERPATERILAIFANPVFQKNDRRLAFTGRADQDQLTQKPPANRNGEEEGAEIDFRPLLHSEKEANAIADLVSPNQVFKAVGFEATREAVVSGRLKGYRNLHFATHGVLDSQRPELSSLVLSLYDRKGERLEGFLRLADIYSLRLDADLVVLSACQTALGKEIRGEGLVGLTRGFMNAGAGRVLASLWSVQDEPTAKLMTLFYRGMLKEDLSAAAALRKAQLEMAQDPDRKSPYYWAGFSLQGEWR